MSEFSRSTSFSRSKSSNRRTPTSGSPKVLLHRQNSDGLHRNGWVSQNFYIIVTIGPLITFILALSCGYFYVFPNLELAFHRNDVSSSQCDVFDGNWVPDYSYPLYNSSECPFTEQGFNCLGNGRSDDDYLRWRWKPKNCDISKFDSLTMLERLRGKRVVFVGDSMSRTQWESLICLLMIGVKDKTSVYEVKGRNITKTARHLVVRFHSFNFSIEFYRSVFLVQPGMATKHAPKRVKSTLVLDKLDDISQEWVDSDVLIFNSGHWWVPSKLFTTGCYFQLADSLKLGMSIDMAYKTALSTWASWMDASINSTRTRVFFRTFEPSHWSNESSAYCNVTRFPTPETENSYESPFTNSVLNMVMNMKTPVTVLRITSMTASRSDAHVGNWSDRKVVPDCSHWCLPGVPDIWNEILLSYLFPNKDLQLRQFG
ncbi:protein trichome berefringence-like 7 isoform X2 [Silene latifolia]